MKQSVYLMLLLYKVSWNTFIELIFFLITRYTLKNETVYAIVLEWPSSDHLNLGAPVSTADTQVTMLGYDGKFLWEPAGEKGGMVIVFPPIAVNKIPSKWAWVLKLENIK